MTTNLTNTNTNTNTNQLSPHDYLNKGINELSIEHLQLINSERKKTIQTLFISIGILISADIIKNTIQSIIFDNQTYINNSIIDGLKLFSFKNIYDVVCYSQTKLFNIYHNFKFINKKKNTFDYKHKNKNKLNYRINCDSIFQNNLIMLLENYKLNKANYELINDISYKENHTSEIDINQENTIIKKSLSEIKINYKDNFIIEIQKLSYKYNFNGNSTIITNNKLTLYDVFSKKHDELMTMYTCTDYFYSDGTICSHVDINGNVDKKKYPLYNQEWHEPIPIFAQIVFRSVLKNQKTLTEEKLNIIIINLIVLTKLLGKKQRHDKSNQIAQILHSYFPGVRCMHPNYTLNKSLEQYVKSLFDTTELDKFLDYFLNSFSSDKLDYENSIPKHKNSNIENNKKINNNLQNINFEVDNNNISHNQIYPTLIDFINYISSISKKHKINKKITIYSITIKNQKSIKEIENPDYTKYSESKTQLITKKKSITDIISILGVEPDKIIYEEKINRVIDKKIENTKYCSFENLYLRKYQDTELFNLTDRFLNEKKSMEQLGIPNKLGILLYGEPGCGKTTTITTIASYLGRDIFYLNLKLIKTNNELKMIFDYINLEHPGGGVVILEDIDAMTNVVMKRINSNNPNDKFILNKSSDDKITLEYLLNLMDGTLTHNESVLIITTNHLDKLDQALYRPGRIDNVVKLKKCDHYQISRIFKRFIKRDIDTKILNKIKEDTFTPAQIIFNIVKFIKKREETSDEIIMGEFIG